MANKKEIEKGPLAWMAGNSVAANLLMAVLLIGGILWGMTMKQEVFPEFDIDFVVISVPYPGASPEEIEQSIVFVVEEAVQGVDSVAEVTSTAREGMAVINVEMLANANLQKFISDIERAISRITTFPEEAEEPQISSPGHHREVISLALFGETSERVLREVAEDVRDRLIQDKDITQVSLSAIRPFEISIEVPQHILRTYNLTLGDVANKIRKASLELPAGGIRTEGGEVLIRMKERRNFGDEFAKLPIISTASGAELLLEEIATITDGFTDNEEYATYNGKPAVMITMGRVGKETPTGVADAVFRHVEELQDKLPPGIGIEVLDDRSQVFRDRMDLLLKNGYIGLILVFCLLGIFLEARLAFWVAMGIPISFLGALVILPFTGTSINMISLFAFIISLGIVVDDAIIVGENIYKFRQRGVDTFEAAILGVREVARPVTFSILTNIVAFLPLAFVPGFMGKVFAVIPFVVITVFIISLVESLFILPAHLGHQKRRQSHGLSHWLHSRQQRFSLAFSHFVKDRYGPFLDLSLRNRYITLAISLVVLMITISFLASGRLGMTLFPRIDSDFAVATAVLPYGSSVKRTEAVQEKLIKVAEELARENGNGDLVKGIFAQVGGTVGGSSGSHITRVKIYLTPPDERPLNTAEVVKLWREKTGEIAGLESIVFKANAGGPGSGAALTVELTHRDVEVLGAASTELAKALSYFPQVKDIEDGFSPGKTQLDFKIRSEGRNLGLDATDIATQIRHAFYGAEVLRQQRGRNEVKVMVRLPKSERLSEYDIEEMMIKTPKGKDVPLREIVTVERGRAFTSIDRRMGRRVVTVTSDVTPPSDASRILDDLKVETLPDLLKKYPGLSYGFEGKQAEMAESMKGLAMGLLMASMIIYVLLAIPFRSYIQPSIIMVSIPFGIVGAVIGHIIMGYSLSIISMFGIVALSGVVVNDALILVDFVNRARKEGKGLHEAVHASGITRFRPIMLTTLTTFFGLAPMILETSRQARFLIPMAISLGFGIVFATLITLVLVPSLYLIIEDIQVLFGKNKEVTSSQESRQ